MTAIKCSSQRAARMLAFDEGLRHGHSFARGGWYVGTDEELAELDVQPEPVPRTYRVWCTAAYFANVEAQSRAEAITKALELGYAFKGRQEQGWTPCDEPCRPDSLAYVYEAVPCHADGEPESVDTEQDRLLRASMRALLLEHLPTILRRGQLHGASEHESLSAFIGAAEVARGSASLSPPVPKLVKE